MSRGLKLNPGEEISGTLVTPDGKPAVGVKVRVYSRADPEDFAEYGSFADTRSDDHGVFRLNAIQGGKAVFWLLPNDYVPSTHVIDRKRGDLGQFVLEEGIRIRGRVLDVDGKPVPNVWVNAELRKGPAKKSIGMPVHDPIARSALTDAEGRFAMGPLPPGEHRLAIDDHPRDGVVEDRTRRPLPAVFLPQTLTLEAGAPEKSVEIHAAPAVTIEAQYVDSSGKPRSGHAISLFGRYNKTFYYSQGRPNANGTISFQAPKGLEKAELDFSTNEHSVLRIRMGKDAPLSNDRRQELGTLTEDVKGIEIIRYRAPILVVRAVGEDGKTIAGFKPRIDYPPDTIHRDPGSRWVSGVQGDLYFEKQQDGRWRSSQLLPDQQFTLRLEAEGYQPKSETLTLKEGALKEIDWKLTKG